MYRVLLFLSFGFKLIYMQLFVSFAVTLRESFRSHGTRDVLSSQNLHHIQDTGFEVCLSTDDTDTDNDLSEF